MASTTVGVIDLSFGFNPKNLRLIRSYGEEGRHIMLKRKLTADLIYPIVYAFLFAIALIMFTVPSQSIHCFLPLYTPCRLYGKCFCSSFAKSYPTIL
ncbi:MAG: hypothetical protein IPI50_12630 [Saprospiraceae bacterium]|nr:hypothetical protein [Saprospiraceae bacterium]